MARKVTEEQLRDYAAKLMFDMKDEEYTVLASEFDIIEKQMELLGNIKDIATVEPLSFPFITYEAKLRKDIVEESLDVEGVLKNAKFVSNNQVKVPKVVE